MVFTVTSSNCKVKIARFYEFLFTLGWRYAKNKFPFPYNVTCFISKIQQFELPSFHSAWHQNRNAVSLKKSLLLIFSGITISSITRYVHAPEWTPDVFVDFRRPYWYTNMASPHKAPQRCVERFGKWLRNCEPQRPKTWKTYLYISLL